MGVSRRWVFATLSRMTSPPIPPQTSSYSSTRPPGTERGLLLIELLAYLLILGVLSTAFTNWLDYLQRQRLANELNQLQQAFRGAQQFAIASGRTVFVCLATTNNECISDPSAESNWLVHQDISNPASPATSSILQRLPRDSQITASGRWKVWRVGRDGLMRSWGSWLVCNGAHGTKVTINRGLRFTTSEAACDG